SGVRAVRAAKADRSRLPAPRPSPALPFPAIEKATLENGLRVWTVRHTQVPLVAFTLLVRRGAASDPAGKDGLAAVTADMLDEGRGFHARSIRPAVATLIAVGDCDHEGIVRLAADAFGGWVGGVDGDVSDEALVPQAPAITVVPRPRAPQSELRIGHVSAAR